MVEALPDRRRKRRFKDRVYAAAARVPAALANRHRLELLDLLSQRPRTVRTSPPRPASRSRTRRSISRSSRAAVWSRWSGAERSPTTARPVRRCTGCSSSCAPSLKAWTRPSRTPSARTSARGSPAYRPLRQPATRSRTRAPRCWMLVRAKSSKRRICPARSARRSTLCEPARVALPQIEALPWCTAAGRTACSPTKRSRCCAGVASTRRGFRSALPNGLPAGGDVQRAG